MGRITTEREPIGYRWRERFPDAVPVLRAEGGAVYAAESARECHLVRDKGTLADFLPEEDQGRLITVTSYGDREEFARDVVRLRAARGPAVDRRGSVGSPYESVLAALVDASARALERLATERGLVKVNERDHLQPESVKLARELVRHESLTASSQEPLDFRAWPRLGSTDIALARADTPPALLELKCKAGRDALGECVWDAAKLAFAEQCGVGLGFLLAGAPAADWEKPVRGAELFTDAEHDIALCRVVYADWWRHWERRRDPQPTELPAKFATHHLRTARFSVGGSPWQLRLARVRPTETKRLPWPPLTSGSAA